jgi:hypothetical protein
MRTPVALPPARNGATQMQRRRIEQNTTLEERLVKEAQRLRKEAKGTPPGIERERLLRMARQAETASHVSDWLASRGLQAPR